jgi:hypothetical protein
MDKLMPGFDTEIARMAQRLLIQGRPIDYHTGAWVARVAAWQHVAAAGCVGWVGGVRWGAVGWSHQGHQLARVRASHSPLPCQGDINHGVTHGQGSGQRARS